jgi:hypothetical protein
MRYFSDFLNSMIVLCTDLETVAAGNSKANSELGKAMLKLSIFASSLSNECALLKNKLNSALSQTSYTS